MKNQKPSFTEEMSLKAKGYRFIAGVDEVGRGSLMGPVVAAAVIMPGNLTYSWRDEVRDSKQISPAKREYLFGHIREAAISMGIGMASHDYIDARGIIQSTRLAMKMAIERLTPVPQYLLIDYMLLPRVSIPQKGITNGDSLCFSIACASILAKVTRDRMVVEMDSEYPGYGFAGHKGYATREHLDCLSRLGPCPIHRRTFRPVSALMGKLI